MSYDSRVPEFISVVDDQGNSKYRMVVGWDQDNARITVTYSSRYPSFAATFYKDKTRHTSKFDAVQRFHYAFHHIESLENKAKDGPRELRAKYVQYVPGSSLPPENGRRRRTRSPSLAPENANDGGNDRLERLEEELQIARGAAAGLAGEKLKITLENNALKQIIVEFASLFNELTLKRDSIPQEIIEKFKTLKDYAGLY